MKKRKYTFIISIATALILAACHSPQDSETTSPQIESGQTSSPTAAATQPTEATQPTADPRTALTDTEISDLESFFAYSKDPGNRFPKAFFNIALSQIFADAKDINLYSMFSNGDGYAWSETIAEESLINTYINNGEFLDHHRATTENINRILQLCFGITLSETRKNGLHQFLYSEITDSYYHASSAPPGCISDLKIIGGYHEENGDLEVTYIAGGENRVMHLRPTDNGYHILSNTKA